MGSIAVEKRRVNIQEVFAEAMAEAEAAVVKALERRVEEKLRGSIDELLGREAYERRSGVGQWVELAGECQRCKSRRSYRFSRNGGRERTLESKWGVLRIWQQRLVCECGGSVRLEMDGWLRPYQRVGEDVTAQIERWGALRLSLREMQAEAEALHMSPLALRTLNRRLQQVQNAAETGETWAVPPVVQVDAIWVTQLVSNGRYHVDSRGRRRACKSRIKRPIFIALGVWPETDRAEVLAWRLAESEEESSWLLFLSELEALGVRGENGLQLLIHDGGSGLCAALRTVHFAAPQQRCLFHKLRNLYNAIRISEEGLSAQAKRQRRKAIFRDFHHIWQAKRLPTVLLRYLAVVRRYRTTQPDAVRCLRNDFRSTVAFFQILQRHPLWDPKHLRTTSRLERFNRTLRRRIRAASAYHSDSALSFMLAQEVDAFHAQQPPAQISTN